MCMCVCVYMDVCGVYTFLLSLYAGIVVMCITSPHLQGGRGPCTEGREPVFGIHFLKKKEEHN